jgi:hypothetical protein
MGLALRDTQHHCYGDYLTWPGDMRYELIDGYAYAMLCHRNLIDPPIRSTVSGRQI